MTDMTQAVGEAEPLMTPLRGGDITPDPTGDTPPDPDPGPPKG